MLTRSPHSPVDAGADAGALPARERARRQLVAGVMLLYLLAIFEGALRKYAFPEFGQALFFLRDPVLLWLYLQAARHGWWPRASLPARLATWLPVAGAGWLALQVATGSPSEWRLLLGAYGWRAYTLYVPLAFLVGEVFTAADLRRLVRLTLWLALPIAVLVGLQFFSPPGAAINVGTAEDKALQFKSMVVTADHVRATGPFSSNVGQQQFTCTALALLLGYLLREARWRQMGLGLLLAGAAAVFSCVALGGSRGTTLLAAMIGGSALLMGLITRSPRLRVRALTWPLAIGLVAVLAYPLVFPEGFAAFVHRWEVAARDESAFEAGVFGRALLDFTDFLRLIDEVPLAGWGLGFGGNASILLKATVDGVMPGLLAETDFSRHMVDLGPLAGVLYIAGRVGLVLWLGLRVWRVTRRGQDPLPFLLFSYVGYVLLAGQITGNGSISAYIWLFLGLNIAACRHAGQARVQAPMPAGVATAAGARGLRPLRPGAGVRAGARA